MFVCFMYCGVVGNSCTRVRDATNVTLNITLDAVPPLTLNAIHLSPRSEGRATIGAKKCFQLTSSSPTARTVHMEQFLHFFIHEDSSHILLVTSD